MAQLNLYYRVQLETQISLLPEQIDGDLESHLFKNLLRKVEGKTTQYGIVIQVKKIVDFKNGIIDGTNFSGTTVYTVVYDCFICSPVPGLEIICRVQSIINGYIVCANGPVIIAISIDEIDSQFFRAEQDAVFDTNGRQIMPMDYIRVSVTNTQSNLGQKEITVIGKLLNFANDDEIREFEQDQLLVTGGDFDDDKQFI